jgi:1-acyl-sn-glycerol-3-phosphate acyltransferase
VRVFFKSLACFLSLGLYFLAEFILKFLFFPLPRAARRRWATRCMHVFTRSLVGILGIRIRVSGAAAQVPGLGGALFVSSHVSYVDGFVLAATFPLIFVSRGDIKDWPVIGWMARLSGTIFIDRNRRNHLVASVNEMARALADGAHVLLFAEGTTTDGRHMLPFKTSFFDAPVRAGAAVVPVSIVYRHVDGEPFSLVNRDRICWYGEMTFWSHFIGLLRCRSVDVSLEVHDPLWTDVPAGSPDARKQLSDRTRAAVASGTRLLDS